MEHIPEISVKEVAPNAGRYYFVIDGEVMDQDGIYGSEQEALDAGSDFVTECVAPGKVD